MTYPALTGSHRGGRSRRTFTIILILVVLLGAWQLARRPDPAAAAPNTLTYLEQETWTTLYPPSVGYYPNGGIANNIFDRLLYQDPTTLELHPWIATSLPEVNADATEYTFHLRQDVTYSDGSKLDAANVARNFDTFGKGDKARKLTVSEQISNYDHAEVLDPYTVKFVFSAPAPGFAQATSTMNSGLLANSTLELSLEGFGPGNATKIIGSGPFVITDEQVGQSLTLSARTDYDWAPPLQHHTGRALLDQIKIVITPEASVREGALLAGQGDVARNIDAPVEQHLTAQGLSIHAASTGGMNNSFNFRFQQPELADLRVRQAIIHGVDREKLVQTLFSPSYPLATSILAHNALGYVDQSASYTYDPEESKRLLDAAGWQLAADGYRYRDGKKLALTVNYAEVQPRSREVVTFIQSDLRQLGIDLQLLPGDKATQNAAVKDGNKVQIFHTMVGRADYDVAKSLLYSTTRNSLLNYDAQTKQVADPQLQQLLEATSNSPAAADRAAAVKKVQEYVAQQAYVLPLFEEPQVFGMQRYVRDFQTEAVGRPWFYNVWLAK